MFSIQNQNSFVFIQYRKYILFVQHTPSCSTIEAKEERVLAFSHNTLQLFGKLKTSTQRMQTRVWPTQNVVKVVRTSSMLPNKSNLYMRCTHTHTRQHPHTHTMESRVLPQCKEMRHKSAIKIKRAQSADVCSHREYQRYRSMSEREREKEREARRMRVGE